MGFLAGLFGGITLTTALLYLPLLAHQSNRTAQSVLVRHQTATLLALVDPCPQPPPAPRRREQRRGIVEEAKERWNGEVEGAVRWVQRVDWRVVREGVEEGVGEIWRRVRE
ncbi:MAG: hypothetical protein M1839_007875 [Geoglossum umbratile]|nr:MAG: hypothetical protein M1839_007875 [Geoglossum umbratile]